MCKIPEGVRYAVLSHITTAKSGEIGVLEHQIPAHRTLRMR
jgi:uncharacterized protein (UPF0248 family)